MTTKANKAIIFKSKGLWGEGVARCMVFIIAFFIAVRHDSFL